MSITAAHCSRTLIVASIHGSPALRQCAKLLLPGLIECIAKIAVSEESDVLERHSQILAEAFKSFSALFTSTPDDKSKVVHPLNAVLLLTVFEEPRLLGVLLPIMTMLLNPTLVPPSPLHSQSTAQILNFAASSPIAFKEATSKLSAETREALETSVRQALGGSKTTTAEAHKPQISLRSF